MLTGIAPLILFMAFVTLFLLLLIIGFCKQEMFLASRVYDILEISDFKLEIKNDCYLLLEGNDLEYKIMLKTDYEVFEEVNKNPYTRYVSFDSAWRKDIYRALKKQNKKLKNENKMIKQEEKNEEKKRRAGKIKRYQSL